MSKKNSNTNEVAVNSVPTSAVNEQVDMQAAAAAAYAEFVAKFGAAIATQTAIAAAPAEAKNALSAEEKKNALAIATLRKEIETANAAIEVERKLYAERVAPFETVKKTAYQEIARLGGGTKKGGEKGTRTERTECPECNAKSHKGNVTCSIGQRFRAATEASKAAKKPPVAFPVFLQSIAQ